MNEYGLPDAQFKKMEHDKKKLIDQYDVIERNKNLSNMIAEAMEKTLKGIFGEDAENSKFISVKRIPFICNDINEIKEHSKATDLKIQLLDDKFNTLNTRVLLAMGGGAVIVFLFPFAWSLFFK